MLLSLIHPVSSLSVELETTHPDHTAPAELTRTQHLEAVTLLRYGEEKEGAGVQESVSVCVCVCVFRKAACSLLLSLQLVMFCAVGKEGKKGGIKKKKKKTYKPH